MSSKDGGKASAETPKQTQFPDGPMMLWKRKEHISTRGMSPARRTRPTHPHELSSDLQTTYFPLFPLPDAVWLYLKDATGSSAWPRSRHAPPERHKQRRYDSKRDTLSRHVERTSAARPLAVSTPFSRRKERTQAEFPLTATPPTCYALPPIRPHCAWGHLLRLRSHTSKAPSPSEDLEKRYNSRSLLGGHLSSRVGPTRVPHEGRLKKPPRSRARAGVTGNLSGFHDGSRTQLGCMQEILPLIMYRV